MNCNNAITKADYKYRDLSYPDDPDSKLSAKFKDGVLGGSLAYGLQLGDVRAEVEGNVAQNAEDDITPSSWTDGVEALKGKINTKSLMFNAYYDIPTGVSIRPYVGAGMGLARIKMTRKYIDRTAPEENENISKTKTNFAWQIGTGVSYAVTNNWTLDAGYRYMNYGKVTHKSQYNEKESFDVTGHNFYMGVRYTF